MPLSENEQRLLEQIERGLLADDPKFADKVRTTDPHHRAVRRVVLAIVLLIAGVGLMVFGLVSKVAPAGVPVLAILGFLVMFGAAVLGVQAWRRAGRGEPTLQVVDNDRIRPARVGRSSFLDRLEERWRRRADGR